MKIAIVGAGNGGLIVALHLLREHHNTDVEIEIYYDPSIPIEKVGKVLFQILLELFLKY